jgi:hypothetical protein
MAAQPLRRAAWPRRSRAVRRYVLLGAGFDTFAIVIGSRRLVCASSGDHPAAKREAARLAIAPSPMR